MRHPWIPSRKPKRIPSTRPATILDTPAAGEGYEYRASYCGIPLQVFSQPPVNGDFLQEGDTIIARWVPGAGELWFPSPERQQEIIYFSPGGTWPGVWADWHGELWKYDGINLPVHVWTPNALLYEYPSCLAWCEATKRLYIWTWGYDLVSGAPKHRIYKLNPADDSITLVLEHLQWPDLDWSDGGFENPAMDVAEFPLDGCLYAHFACWALDPWAGVIAFDPITETERFAYEYPNPAWEGGICYHPGTAKLLAFSGYQMYESANGINFVLNNDLNVNFSIYDSGPMVLNPDDGNIYLCVEYCDDPPGFPWDGCGGIMKYDGVNWTIDYQYFDPRSARKDTGFKAITNLYPLGGGAIETIAEFWAWWFADEQASVHKKTAGVWGMDWAGPPIGEGWVSPTWQTMVSFRGELHDLKFDRAGWGGDSGIFYGARLYKRDVLGNYTAIMDWAFYEAWANAEYTMCMSPVRTTRKCHEV